MASSVGDDDLYGILGLTEGQDPSSISDGEIKKAYRKRALECHPDKRPGDKAAAAEFNKLQQAYEVLSDTDARKAYDAVRRLRREREARLCQQSSKRQRMVAELEERERASDQQRSKEAAARYQLKRELERLRQEAAERRAKAATAAGAAQNQVAAAAAGPVSEEMRRTLKVSWQVEEGSTGEYTAQRLREVFSEFGGVEDVVVKGRKSKKGGSGRGSALVVLASKDAAVAACRTPCGDPLIPLTVALAVPLPSAPGSASSSWDSPFASVHTQRQAQPESSGPGVPGVHSTPRGDANLSHASAGHGKGGQEGTTAAGAQGQKPTQGGTVGSSFKGYENEILQKMMQAAAKARQKSSSTPQ